MAQSAVHRAQTDQARQAACEPWRGLASSSLLYPASCRTIGVMGSVHRQSLLIPPQAPPRLDWRLFSSPSATLQSTFAPSGLAAPLPVLHMRGRRSQQGQGSRLGDRSPKLLIARPSGSHGAHPRPPSSSPSSIRVMVGPPARVASLFLSWVLGGKIPLALLTTPVRS